MSTKKRDRKDCKGSSAAANCNRTPFKSDASCSRGSVDIRQFNSFPFCDSFDIPEPDIPPEVVDSPLELPVPTPCSCIKIEYNMSLGYNKDNREFKVQSASFVTKGDDCCEGNYVSNFSLKIPCPIIGNGKAKKIKVKIGYGDGKGSAEKSYLTADSSKCDIEAKDASFDLNIPCPVKDTGNHKVKVGIAYGNGPREVEKPYLSVDPAKCKLTAYSPDVQLNIPCPVQGKTPKIKAGVGWGDKTKSASAKPVQVNTGACTIKGQDDKLDMTLACPIVSGDPVISVSIGYGEEFGGGDAQFMHATGGASCSIEGMNANIDLKIPCPISSTDDDGNTPKIKLKLGWGSTSHSASQGFLEANSTDCYVYGKTVDMRLNLECPVRNTKERKIKFGKIKYGNAESQSKVFLKEQADSCKIEGTDSASFNLVAPCPVTNELISFKGSWEYAATDGDPGITFEDEQAPTGEQCKRIVKCKIVFPKGGGGGDASTSGATFSYGASDGPLADIKYDTETHQIQVRRWVIKARDGLIKSQSKGGWKMITGGQAVDVNDLFDVDW